MHAVINHLHLTVPPEQIAEEFAADGIVALASLPGFKGAYLVQEAPDRLVVILHWDSAEDAMNGGRAFGPTWFAEHIAPYLASEQQRTVGPVLFAYHPAE